MCRCYIMKSIVLIILITAPPMVLAGLADDFLNDLPVTQPPKAKAKDKRTTETSPKYLREDQIIRGADGDIIGYAVRGKGKRVNIFSINGIELGFIDQENNGKVIFTPSLKALQIEAESKRQNREASKQWVDEFNRSQEKKQQEALHELIELDREIRQGNQKQHDRLERMTEQRRFTLEQNTSAHDLHSSPYDFGNSEYNHENSPYNQRNSPFSHDNSLSGFGDNARVIRDNAGKATGYMVTKPDGGVNFFNADGSRTGYLPRKR